jgi:hypothetical protein
MVAPTRNMQTMMPFPRFFLNDEKKVGASPSMVMVFAVLLVKASLTREDEKYIRLRKRKYLYAWTRREKHPSVAATPSYQES